MSTEATGDGQTDAVGAVEPEVAAEDAGPPAAVVAAAGVAEPTVAGRTAWDTASSAWVASAPPGTGADEAAEATADETTQADAAIRANETDQAFGTGAPLAGNADAEASGVVDLEVVDVEVVEVVEPAGVGGSSEPDKTDELDDSSQGGEPYDEQHADEHYGAEPHEPGEADEGYDGYGEGEAAEYDKNYQQDGSYQEDDEYEPEEAAAPRRARRWPRVLLALGFVVLAAVIVGGAIAIVGSVTHGFKKPVKVTYTKSPLFNLRIGQCFDPRGQSYSLVSCDSPHVAEVFATFALSGSKWPGATAVAADASSGCATRLTGYLNPQLAISLSSTYVYPDSVAWQAGTRTVICEVRATSGELTGSVRGASATAG